MRGFLGFGSAFTRNDMSRRAYRDHRHFATTYNTGPRAAIATANIAAGIPATCSSRAAHTA